MLDAILVGVGIGILSGMLGIGGGPVLIPLLVYLFHLNMQQAAGTSLAIIIPTALVGVLNHYGKGNVDLSLAALVAIGGMLGAYIGSGASEYIPSDSLRKVFALVLIYIAIRMLLAGRG